MFLAFSDSSFLLLLNAQFLLISYEISIDNDCSEIAPTARSVLLSEKQLFITFFQ